MNAGFDVLVERFLHQHFGGELALAAGIAGEVGIDAVSHVFAGQTDFVGVDDDNVVAALGVRGVGRFVLAAQQLGYLRAQAAQGLVSGIDEHPFVVYLMGVGRYSLVA